MKNQRKRTLMAMALAVSMLFSLPIWGTSSARALDEAMKCSLTMTPGGEFEDNDIIENAKVVIDLYKVADAKKDESYDTYHYEVTGGFTGLASALTEGREELDSESWAALADQAAGIALDSQARADASISLNGTAGGLDWGLYLVVAHGEDLAVADYYKNEDGRVVTIARSPEYEYSFFPYLVSLPSTRPDVDANPELGPMNTSDGTWEYDVTGSLKPDREPRFGDLTIVKTLNSYNPATGATFVFDVTARKNGETVYSNVVSMNFTGAGEQRYTLTKIPAEAEVTVTEIYSGTAYTAQVGTQSTTIAAADVVRVNFVNDYTGGGNYGGGVLNHFAYTPGGEDGTQGSWEWMQQ